MTLDSTLITVLTGSGVCGVFCLLFIAGWIYPKNVVDDLRAENAELKKDRDHERERADTFAAVAASTKDVLAAIQLGTSLERRGS